MLAREAYVANARVLEVRGLVERGREQPEALGRDRREQSGAVLEVVGGRRVRDAGAAGEVAQAQCGGAVGGDDVQRGAEDGAAQVAVVVPAGASSVFFGSVGLMGSSVRSI